MADIEIVIKISEEEYIDIKDAINSLIENGVERASMSKVCLSILDGTPLPKGHGRLGDLDALRDEVSSWGMNDYEPSDFIDAIDDVPTTEAIPKANYEARLRVNMMTMLEDLKKEMNPIKKCEQQIYGKEEWNFVGKC